MDDLLATFDPEKATLETLLPAFAELVNRFRIIEQERSGLGSENEALRAENAADRRPVPPGCTLSDAMPSRTNLILPAFRLQCAAAPGQAQAV